MLSTAPKGADAGAVASPAWTSRIPIEWLGLGGVTVLAGALRFATLGSQSYWFDEAQAAHELTLSLGGLLHTIGHQETSPPLYFVLGWLWAKVFGVGEFGLRSLSALLGTAVIPITYLCGRELVSRRAGLVAALFAALSPFLIWYSQEAREYMLLTALCGASLLFFARALREPSGRNLGWWVLFSALALLTHFFAGFLVAPEAAWLLWRARSRSAVAAVGAVAIVELALLPLALSDSDHPLGWLTAIPLHTRIEQVPVGFALATLYQSSIVTYGLLGAGVFAAAVVALLVAGATARELRGAGIAAVPAGFVLLVPLALAALGHDFYIVRALLPAWIPLAVLTAAACTASHARLAGGALAAVIVVAFVFAGVRIDGSAQYQRTDWRAVAAALGRPSGTRAIVVYNGQLATDPLIFYLGGISWRGPAATPVALSELDVVGSPLDTAPASAPPGTALISRRQVAGFLVERYALAGRPALAPAAITARAGTLLAPGSGAALLVQHR